MPIVSPTVYMTLDDKYSKLSNGAWRLMAIAEVIMVAPIQTICRSSSKDEIYAPYAVHECPHAADECPRAHDSPTTFPIPHTTEIDHE